MKPNTFPKLKEIYRNFVKLKTLDEIFRKPISADGKRKLKNLIIVF